MKNNNTIISASLRRWWCQTIAIFLISFFSISVSYAQTLNQIVLSTLYSNPTLNAQRANVAVQYHLIYREKGGFYPQVSLQFADGVEHTKSPFTLALDDTNQITLNRRESSVNAQQLLFDGGFVYNQYKKQQFVYESAVSIANQTAETIILNTVEAYLNVLRYKQIIKYSRINVQTHLKTLRKVETLFRGRVATKADVSLALSRLALARTRLQEAIALYQRARADYLKVTGTLPPPIMEKPSAPFSWMPHSLASAEQITDHKNPTLRAAMENVIAAEKNVKSARALFFPRVDLLLSASYNKNLDGVSGPNDDQLAMVNVTYDIFKGGSDLANYHAAINEKVRAIYQEEEIHRNIFRDLHDAWIEFHSTHRQLKSLTQYVKQSEIVVKAYYVQYELGKRALFNLLDQERELFQSRVEYTNAYFDHDISIYRIMSNMGELRKYFTPPDMMTRTVIPPKTL